MNYYYYYYYYSISVDSTPDLSHTDQLAVTVRYVLDGVPTERFLTFFPIKSHKAAELVKYLLDFLESQGIDIMNCRGQPTTTQVTWQENIQVCRLE